MAMMQQPFWRQKSFAEMTVEEWESLCDGCGKCCLVKLQDEDTDEVAYTSVACQYLDCQSCRCQAYAERTQLVEGCVNLKPDMIEQFFWLPASCSYRLVAEGRELPDWHPLLSGSRKAMHAGGHSVQGKVISESAVNPDDLEDYIVYWVE